MDQATIKHTNYPVDNGLITVFFLLCNFRYMQTDLVIPIIENFTQYNISYLTAEIIWVDFVNAKIA